MAMGAAVPGNHEGKTPKPPQKMEKSSRKGSGDGGGRGPGRGGGAEGGQLGKKKQTTKEERRALQVSGLLIFLSWLSVIVRSLQGAPQSLVLFPDPTNPSEDRFQYRATGKEGRVTFVTFLCLNVMCRYLDLSQGLAPFVLIRPYLKSCCLPVPSVEAAISPFLNRLY